MNQIVVSHTVRPRGVLTLPRTTYFTPNRAVTRRLLEALPLDENSDDFVFDNQMLAQIHWLGCTIAEVTCPTKYFAEASSINLRRSITYGFGCLHTAATYRLARQGWLRVPRFERLPPALPATAAARPADADDASPAEPARPEAEPLLVASEPRP